MGSHFIALHLSAELRVEPWDEDDEADKIDHTLSEDEQHGFRTGGSTRIKPRVPQKEKPGIPRILKIWRNVPAKPDRRAGLSFVRGEKFEERELSDDESGT